MDCDLLGTHDCTTHLIMVMQHKTGPQQLLLHRRNKFLKTSFCWAVYDFNPSTEAAGYLCVPGQPGLQSKCQNSQGWTPLYL